VPADRMTCTVTKPTMALSGTRHNEVPPNIPSGVARMKPFLLLGLMTLTGVYFFLVYALKDSVCPSYIFFVFSRTGSHVCSICFLPLLGILLGACRNVLSR
jgi:hypothetical protein